jgi:hypothetical protein
MIRTIGIVTLTLALLCGNPGCLGVTVMQRATAGAIAGNLITGAGTKAPLVTIRGTATALVIGRAAETIACIGLILWQHPHGDCGADTTTVDEGSASQTLLRDGSAPSLP